MMMGPSLEWHAAISATHIDRPKSCTGGRTSKSASAEKEHLAS
jgi:hypothetical protein